MPLTEKGEKILHAMEEQYGKEKGEEVFYASKNKGTISGVDSADAPVDAAPGTSLPVGLTPAEINQRNEKHWKQVSNCELEEGY